MCLLAVASPKLLKSPDKELAAGRFGNRVKKKKSSPQLQIILRGFDQSAASPQHQ